MRNKKLAISLSLFLSSFLYASSNNNVATEQIDIGSLPSVSTMSKKEITHIEAENLQKDPKNIKLLTKPEFIDRLLKQKKVELDNSLKKSEDHLRSRDEVFAKIIEEKKQSMEAIDAIHLHETIKLKEEYLKKLKLAEEKKNKDIQTTIEVHDIKKKSTILEFEKISKRLDADINDIQVEIAKIQEMKKVKKRVEQPSIIASLYNDKVFFEYVDRHKSLTNAVLKMGFTTTLDIYIKILKKGYPFNIEDRTKNYLIEVAKTDNDIDFEFLEPMIHNKDIKSLQNTLSAIAEYKNSKY